MWIDREKVLQAAQGFVAKKKYDKAVAEYQKLIQQDPDDARTLLKVGDLQSKMEAWGDAVASYEKVAKHYAAQGFALKAVAVYKQIREILQKHVPHLEDRYSYIIPKLAELYTQLGLVSDAMAAYEEVAARLQRAGRDREAVDVLKKIVQVDGSNPLPHLRLAEAYSRLSDVAAAVRQFTTAAEILQKLGRADDALKVYERLLHHRPETSIARKAAEMYLARGQQNDGMLALAKLQLCFQADPRNLETLELLGRAFVAIGQAAKAFEVQKEMARLAKEQGKTDVHKRVVEQLLRIAPDDDAVRALAGLEKKAPPPPPPPPPVVQHAPPPRAPARASVVELDEDELVEGSVPPPGGSSADLEVVEQELLEVVDDELTGEELEKHERHVLALMHAARRANQSARAVIVLQDGLVLAPHSQVIRMELRDLLLEQGDIEGAVSEMLALASAAVDTLDGEAAHRHLMEVLQFAPDNARAIEMLTALGYEWSGGSHADVLVEPVDAPFGSVEPPAMALDEPDLPPPPRAPVVAPPPPKAAPLAPPAPIAPPAPPVAKPAPIAPPPPSAPKAAPAPPRPAAPPRPVVVTAAAPPPPPAPAAELQDAPEDHIQEALDEIDFFVSSGMVEDAKNIVEEHLAKYPGDPHLLAKQRALAEGAGSGPRPAPSAADDHANDVFDIAAALDALDVPTADNLRPEFGSVEQQIDVEEVFAKFKEGVKAQISEADSATHYDLGIAYQEMALLADAIEEFALAARDPKRTVVCESFIANIQRSQGKLDDVIATWERALAAEMKTDDQEVGILYELGDVCEAAGDPKRALGYFQRVSRLAVGYSDPRGTVAERIAALQPNSGRTTKVAVADADDDFDAAFDALLGGD